MRAPTTISRLSCMQQHSTTRRSRLAAAGLFVSPFLLAPTIIGLLAVPVIAALVGPTVWPWLTRRNATGVGAVTLVTLMVGATLVFPFAGLCGPNTIGCCSGALLSAWSGTEFPRHLRFAARGRGRWPRSSVQRRLIRRWRSPWLPAWSGSAEGVPFARPLPRVFVAASGRTRTGLPKGRSPR